MSVPSGAMATAGKSGRSPAAAALTGADQLTPLLSDHWSRACSLFRPARASHQVSTIWSVASAPVGAPLAMSTLGKLLVRAPATPSKVKRPCTGSKAPQSTTLATVWGCSKVWPPSKERRRMIADCRCTDPAQNTYTTPSESVRTAQPWRPPVWALLVAALSWRRCQVSPASVERANTTGSGAALPCPEPRKATLQTYTLPKWGLEAALSAQICSLSLNRAAFCLVTSTGSSQAPAFPAAAAATLSVRDT